MENEGTAIFDFFHRKLQQMSVFLNHPSFLFFTKNFEILSATRFIRDK
jgi:hypothetical protein